MDYEKLGLITDEEMSELSKVETDGVMADTDELKSAAAGAAAGGGASYRTFILPFFFAFNPH